MSNRAYLYQPTTCPICGDRLGSQDRECYTCGYPYGVGAQELPEYLQGALGFMQTVAQKVENGEPLTPSEMQLLAQAGTYARMAG